MPIEKLVPKDKQVSLNGGNCSLDMMNCLDRSVPKSVPDVKEVTGKETLDTELLVFLRIIGRDHVKDAIIKDRDNKSS